jgi:hypothetical protein
LRKDAPQTSIAAANSVYELRNNGSLVNYLHKAMFSPTKAAFIKAVKLGQSCETWPVLTEDAINKHLKMTPATAMGRMNQKIQNIHSTSKEMQVKSDVEHATVTPAGTGEKQIWFTQ